MPVIAINSLTDRWAAGKKECLLSPEPLHPVEQAVRHVKNSKHTFAKLRHDIVPFPSELLLTKAGDGRWQHTYPQTPPENQSSSSGFGPLVSKTEFNRWVKISAPYQHQPSTRHSVNTQHVYRNSILWGTGRGNLLHAVKNKEWATYLAEFPFLPFITIIFNQPITRWLGAQHTPCSLTARIFCPPFASDHRWTRTQIGRWHQCGTEEILPPPWRRIHKKRFSSSDTTTNPTELSPTAAPHRAKTTNVNVCCLGLRSHLNKDSPRGIVFV